MHRKRFLPFFYPLSLKYATIGFAFLGWILSFGTLLAATCNSQSHGAWTTTSVWSCGRTPSTYYPGPDNATITHTLTSVDLSFANSQHITLSSSGILTVTGNLTLGGNSVLTINGGTLTVTGNLTVGDGAKIVLNGGAIVVGGDAVADGGGGTYEVKSGSLKVAKDLVITGSNSRLTNLGTITAKSLFVGGGSTNTLSNSGTLTVTNKTTINSIFTNTGAFSTGADLEVAGGNANFSNSGNGTSAIGGNMSVSGSAKYTMKGGKTTVDGHFTNDGGATSTINGWLTVKKSFTNSATINTDAGSANEGILQWNAAFTHNWGGTITPATGATITGNSSASSQPPYNPYSLKTGLGPAFLPIQLLSFAAKWVNTEVVLNWSTLSEEDFSHFSVERSHDAKNFSVLTQIKGAGNSKTLQRYQYTDASSYEGNVTYYRLQSVDENGEYSYSKIISVTRASVEEVKVYPNPVLDGMIRIHLVSDESAPMFALYTNTGTMVFSTPLQPGNNTIILPATVLPNLYVVAITSDHHVQKNKLVVK